MGTHVHQDINTVNHGEEVVARLEGVMHAYLANREVIWSELACKLNGTFKGRKVVARLSTQLVLISKALNESHV